MAKAKSTAKPKSKAKPSKSKSAAPSPCGTTLWIWLDCEWHQIKEGGKCKDGCKKVKPPRDGNREYELIKTLCRKPSKRKKRTSNAKGVGVTPDCDTLWCEVNENGDLVDNCSNGGCGTGGCSCTLVPTGVASPFVTIAICECLELKKKS